MRQGVKNRHRGRRVMRTRGLARNDFVRLCDQAGLTLEQAAARLEVSERTAYRYASGASQPSRLAMRVLRSAASSSSPSLHSPDQAGFRFIDLFAGIGGLRLGFQEIGGHCVFTSEWDANSQKTYALNFRDNHPIGGDIREFSQDPSKIPEHDVLLAGFPCQPFSIAGVSKKNARSDEHT